jgi:ribosome-associated protein
MLHVNARIQIPLAEFEFTYARSSGPGGQNVNKVNSKATLRWGVRRSPSLPDDVKERFLAAYGSRVTTEGEILIVSQKFRDQAKNVDDCLAKLREMLAAVAVAPRKRRPTKPTRGSRERRLREKRTGSERKRLRGKPGRED